MRTRRHGFQTAVVLVGPGLKFGGALEDLTAHWTTTALDETAHIGFEGEGAGLLSVSRHDVAGIWAAFFSRCQRDRCWQGIRDLVKATQRSNLAAYMPTDCERLVHSLCRSRCRGV